VPADGASKANGDVFQQGADGKRSGLQGTAASMSGAGLWWSSMGPSFGYIQVATSGAWATGLFASSESYGQKALG